MLGQSNIGTRRQTHSSSDHQSTYITGDVGVSAGGEDRDGVTLDLKLLGFRFLPVVPVAVLQGGRRPVEKSTNVEAAIRR